MSPWRRARVRRAALTAWKLSLPRSENGLPCRATPNASLYHKPEPGAVRVHHVEPARLRPSIRDHERHALPVWRPGQAWVEAEAVTAPGLQQLGRLGSVGVDHGDFECPILSGRGMPRRCEVRDPRAVG